MFCFKPVGRKLKVRHFLFTFIQIHTHKNEEAFSLEIGYSLVVFFKDHMIILVLTI